MRVERSCVTVMGMRSSRCSAREGSLVIVSRYVGAEGCVFTGMEHTVGFGVRCAGNVCWDAGSGVGI